MKYLRACLNESLRLYPVVPLNSREALEDTILPRGGGEDGMAPIFIPKGGLVSWNLWALHRRKDYFGEDAEVFRPERWLDEDGEEDKEEGEGEGGKGKKGKKGLRPGWEYLRKFPFFSPFFLFFFPFSNSTPIPIPPSVSQKKKLL